MLTKAEDMRVFLKLAEQSAPMKKYTKQLGFKGGDVRVHIKFINYYRAYLKMTDEVLELAKQKKGASLLEKARINMKIRAVRSAYRPILSKLKGKR